MDDRQSDADGVRRRPVLAAVAAGGVGVLAGCLGDGSTAVPGAVALDGGEVCDNCGMRIENHPGPAGQSFYLDDRPDALPDDREDGIAWFCSLFCTYTFNFRAEDSGHEPAGSYATDYSAVEYSLETDAGTTVVSAHLGAEAFERLGELTLVVDSDVEGAMGGSLIGFSDPDDAAAFADEHGGDLIEHGEVTPEIVSTLSGNM